MLSNAEYNCQTNDLHEVSDNKPLDSAIAEHTSAANAPQFNAAGRTSGRLRRDRQFSGSTGLAVAGWRVTSW